MSAIQNLMAVGQPSLAYNWEINMRSPFVSVDELKFRARSAGLPDDASEPIEIPHKFYNIYFLYFTSRLCISMRGFINSSRS